MTGLLIFDFDGVIADSEVPANQVVAECVTEPGVPTTREDSCRLYMGKRFPDVLSAVVQVTGRVLPADFAESFQARTLDRFRTTLQPVRRSRQAASSGRALCGTLICQGCRIYTPLA